MSDKITAYLSVGSTYSFLTALRLRDLIEYHDIDLTIVPISIRSIMKEMNNIPFPPEKVAKVNYMWRDIERRAELYGLPKPKVPVPYPLKEFDRANLVGVVINARGLFLNYLEATYRAWFLDGIEAGSDENLRQCMGKTLLSHANQPLQQQCMVQTVCLSCLGYLLPG